MIENETATLRAFHSDPAVKARYLARVEAHRAAGELEQGETGRDGKGDAVWCTLDAYVHFRYPVELGIPEWLAWAEERLFDGLSQERAPTFPCEFLAAVQPGADLERAKGPFLIHLLRSTLRHVDAAAHPAAVDAVERSIALWERRDIGSIAWRAAARVAEAVAGQAAEAAEAADEKTAPAKAVAETAWHAARAAEAAASATAWAVEVVPRAAFRAVRRAAAKAVGDVVGNSCSTAETVAGAPWSAEPDTKDAAWAAEKNAANAACDDHANALLCIIGAIPGPVAPAGVARTLDVGDPSRYPTELGIPEWLAGIDDQLFEGMSQEPATTWPRDLLAAIQPGLDLERAKGPFLVHVLRSALRHVDRAAHPAAVDAVETVIALWDRGDIGSTAWTADAATAKAIVEPVRTVRRIISEPIAEAGKAYFADAAASSARAKERAFSAVEAAFWAVSDTAGDHGRPALWGSRPPPWGRGAAAYAVEAALDAAEPRADWTAEAARAAVYDDHASALLGFLRALPLRCGSPRTTPDFRHAP